MSRCILYLAIASALLANLCVANRSDAAGMLIADGGFGGVLEIKEQNVSVTINNGIAVTQVDQIFVNTENRVVEALYTFPVPKGASVANFSMWINGKEMIGEVVEKQRAREIYESYKATRVDPGLLEQVDFKTFEMRIYPINAKAEQRVRLEYYQELEYDNDQATYVYPLSTVSGTNIAQKTTGRMSLTMKVLSEIPIERISSVSHGDQFAIASHGPNLVEASFEANGGDLSRDFVLTYKTARAQTGIDLVTSTPPGEDGYFMMTMTAGDELAKLDEPMDYVFVLDISGSMADAGKLQMSQNSIEAFVRALSPDDRFDIMTFNMQPTTLFGNLMPVSTETLNTASSFLASQQARGGTSLTPAIKTAYRYGDPDRRLNVVVMSDGMTDQGESSELLNLIRQSPRNAKVFTIGVGNEVNRRLLSQMAEDAGGLAAFISQGDDFQRQAKSFRRKLLRPAITDVSLSIEGADIYDLVPAEIPNLYHGAPVRVYGRFRGADKLKVTYAGDVLGRPSMQSFDHKIGNEQVPEVERMWAVAKVDQLIRAADVRGSRQSSIDEIVRLGETYSIVTEYTSLLVLENDAEYRRWKIDRANLGRTIRDRENREQLNAQLSRMKDQAFAQLGPKNQNRNQTPPGNSTSVPPSFTTPSSTKVHNTPEPSAGILLFMALVPVAHHVRRTVANRAA